MITLHFYFVLFPVEDDSLQVFLYSVVKVGCVLGLSYSPLTSFWFWNN